MLDMYLKLHLIAVIPDTLKTHIKSRSQKLALLNKVLSFSRQFLEPYKSSNSTIAFFKEIYNISKRAKYCILR